MVRPDGRYIVTCAMNEADFKTLQAVMQQMNRRSMSDCVRALIADAAEKFLISPSVMENNPRTPRRATAAK